MVKAYTAHECELVRTDIEAFAWADAHPHCDFLLTQLEADTIDGFALGGNLSERFPKLQTAFFPAYRASEQRLEIRDTRIFPEPIDGERLLAMLQQAETFALERGDVFHPADILQMCCLSRKGGAIQMVSSGRSGLVFLRKGKLTYAEADGLKGHAALLEIIAWNYVEFPYDSSLRPAAETISGRWDEVLIDAVRHRKPADRSADSGNQPLRAATVSSSLSPPFCLRECLSHFHPGRVTVFSASCGGSFLSAFSFCVAASAQAQIQVELKFKRLQYVAYEPVIATLSITNLAGRDVVLRDGGGQHWFGFEVTADESRPIAPAIGDAPEPPLRIETGKTVTRKVNLEPIYPVHDFGTYHVRANVYFADMGKFFYSSAKVFRVGDARPIWQKTVGLPDGVGSGNVRTFSLLSNRFPDHTSLYVRVEDKDRGVVYSTFSLGRILAVDDPQAELDRANQLHVLHCASPRSWAYSRIGLNGELLEHDVFMETKSRPHLRRTANGMIAVSGGMSEKSIAQSPRSTAPKLSARPGEIPNDE